MSEAASAERTQAKTESGGQPANPSPEAANRVAELQVSAHLMTLESGLFCVFQTQGSAPPDPATGLPGVRITPAPGIAGRPEAVSVSTFREDGWLNGTAALVRVTDGSAQILVTIYQNKGMDAAPRLQVLRLSGDPAAPEAPAAAVATAANPAAAPAEPTANPEVMAHVQRMGDVGCNLGDWLGQKGSRQWVEGFGMAPNNGIALEDIEYQAVLGRNWLSPWVEGGKFCGSRGMALPLLGLKVRLKGTAAEAFTCSYSATFVDGSAVGPVNGGETCEAESLAALEAFQIVIQTRDARTASKPPAGKTSAAASAAKTAPALKPAAKATRTPAAKPLAKTAPKPPAKRRAKY
ncbi:MAG TPA: hypothetical protein VHU42_00295 [Rhodopila sp.]|nr:hypothetical protein [Rhodopila sp.]